MRRTRTRFPPDSPRGASLLGTIPLVSFPSLTGARSVSRYTIRVCARCPEVEGSHVHVLISPAQALISAQFLSDAENGQQETPKLWGKMNPENTEPCISFRLQSRRSQYYKLVGPMKRHQKHESLGLFSLRLVRRQWDTYRDVTNTMMVRF